MPATTLVVRVLYFATAALLGAIGQYLYKSGAEEAGASVLSYLVNVRLLGGVVCYAAVMLLFVAAFKQGGALTVLYPVYASTFIWAALVAWRVDDTPIKAANVVGMLPLVLGMYLMGRP